LPQKITVSWSWIWV